MDSSKNVGRKRLGRLPISGGSIGCRNKEMETGVKKARIGSSYHSHGVQPTAKSKKLSTIPQNTDSEGLGLSFSTSFGGEDIMSAVDKLERDYGCIKTDQNAEIDSKLSLNYHAENELENTDETDHLKKREKQSVDDFEISTRNFTNKINTKGSFMKENSAVTSTSSNYRHNANSSASSYINPKVGTSDEENKHVLAAFCSSGKAFVSSAEGQKLVTNKGISKTPVSKPVTENHMTVRACQLKMESKENGKSTPKLNVNKKKSRISISSSFLQSPDISFTSPQDISTPQETLSGERNVKHRVSFAKACESKKGKFKKVKNKELPVAEKGQIVKSTPIRCKDKNNKSDFFKSLFMDKSSDISVSPDGGEKILCDKNSDQKAGSVLTVKGILTSSDNCCKESDQSFDKKEVDIAINMKTKEYNKNDTAKSDRTGVLAEDSTDNIVVEQNKPIDVVTRKTENDVTHTRISFIQNEKRDPPETSERQRCVHNKTAFSGNELCLSSWGLPEPVLKQYHSRGITQMFTWQAECLQIGNVLGGGNLVYSAPTSAGKTMVAELLVLKRVLETRKKALIILPFVSVTREKMFYLQELYQDAGIRVSGFMGHYGPAGGFSSVDVAVCTIEKGNGLINRLLEENKLDKLGIIVVDELHLLGDNHRGYLLELMLTKIRYMGQRTDDKNTGQIADHNVQIVGMSATLPNLDLLAAWLNADLYRTDYRPVPLTECFKMGTALYDSSLNLLRDIDTTYTVKGDDDHIVPLCIETVRDGHGILIFCPTKNWCEKLSETVAREFYNLLKNTKIAIAGKVENNCKPNLLVLPLDQSSLRDVVEQLRRTPVGLDTVLGRTVPFGVAYHHAGLTFDERDIVEGAFRQGILKVLIATSTLSSGVNLPARRVIIRTPVFHGQLIDFLTYKQMIGRAGRKGVDTAGESILLCKPNEKPKALTLVQSALPPVRSTLIRNEGEKLSSSMKRAILEVVVSGIAMAPKEVALYASCTLLAASVDKTDDNTQDLIDECITFLQENEFVCCQKVTENGETTERFVPTQLGAAVLASSMGPDEGLKVFSELQRARQCFVLENELHIIYLVTPIYAVGIGDSIDWYQYFCLWESLPAGVRRVAELVGVKESFLAKAVRGRILTKTETQLKLLAIHKRFYTALVLHDLVQEMPLNEVVRKYNCNKGQLQSLQQSAATFAGMVTIFCARLGWSNLELILSQFQNRLTFGVQRELCDLVKLSSLNGQRARIFYNGGYQTVAAIASASLAHIEALLKNSAPFQSNKKQDTETEWEAAERRKTRCIFLPGRKGLTEYEAAKIIIEEAKALIQEELGGLGIQWNVRTPVPEIKSPVVTSPVTGRVPQSKRKGQGNRRSCLTRKSTSPKNVNDKKDSHNVSDSAKQPILCVISPPPIKESVTEIVLDNDSKQMASGIDQRNVNTVAMDKQKEMTVAKNEDNNNNNAASGSEVRGPAADRKCFPNCGKIEKVTKQNIVFEVHKPSRCTTDVDLEGSDSTANHSHCTPDNHEKEGKKARIQMISKNNILEEDVFASRKRKENESFEGLMNMEIHDRQEHENTECVNALKLKKSISETSESKQTEAVETQMMDAKKACIDNDSVVDKHNVNTKAAEKRLSSKSVKFSEDPVTVISTAAKQKATHQDFKNATQYTIEQTDNQVFFHNESKLSSVGNHRAEIDCQSNFKAGTKISNFFIIEKGETNVPDEEVLLKELSLKNKSVLPKLEDCKSASAETLVEKEFFDSFIIDTQIDLIKAKEIPATQNRNNIENNGNPVSKSGYGVKTVTNSINFLKDCLHSEPLFTQDDMYCSFNTSLQNISAVDKDVDHKNVVSNIEVRGNSNARRFCSTKQDLPEDNNGMEIESDVSENDLDINILECGLDTSEELIAASNYERVVCSNESITHQQDMNNSYTDLHIPYQSGQEGCFEHNDCEKQASASEHCHADTVLGNLRAVYSKGLGDFSSPKQAQTEDKKYGNDNLREDLAVALDMGDSFSTSSVREVSVKSMKPEKSKPNETDFDKSDMGDSLTLSMMEKVLEDGDNLNSVEIKSSTEPKLSCDKDVSIEKTTTNCKSVIFSNPSQGNSVQYEHTVKENTFKKPDVNRNTSPMFDDLHDSLLTPVCKFAPKRAKSSQGTRTPKVQKKYALDYSTPDALDYDMKRTRGKQHSYERKRSADKLKLTDKLNSETKKLKNSDDIGTYDKSNEENGRESLQNTSTESDFVPPTPPDDSQSCSSPVRQSKTATSSLRVMSPFSPKLRNFRTIHKSQSNRLNQRTNQIKNKHAVSKSENETVLKCSDSDPDVAIQSSRTQTKTSDIVEENKDTNKDTNIDIDNNDEDDDKLPASFLDLNESGIPLTQSSFTIIDVCADKRLFKTFIMEWRMKSKYAVTLACEKKRENKAPGFGIGGKFQKNNTPIKRREDTDVGMLLDDGLILVGVAVSWENRDAYYIALSHDSPEGDADDSLAPPPSDPDISFSIRQKAIKSVLQQEKCKEDDVTIFIFDMKTQYRAMVKGLGFAPKAKFEDPKIACWLLDPGAREKNLHKMVTNLLPSEVHMLNGIGGGIGYGSLGMSPQNPGSGRYRATTECVLVRHLAEYFRACLLKENLYSAFCELEMPAAVSLCRMELNGFGFSEEECETQKNIMTAKLSALEEQAYSLAGHPFSLSSTEDIAQVLFIELQLPPNGDPGAAHLAKTLAFRGRGGARRGGQKCQFSTSKEILEKLRKLHPLPGILLEWRRITNALTKVVFPLQKEKVLCPLLDMYRIFSECQLHSATGRVSLSEPNLQNIPKDFEIKMPDLIGESPPTQVIGRQTRAGKSKLQQLIGQQQSARVIDDSSASMFCISMRHAFVPFTGGVLLAADYSQLELRMIAYLSGDEKLIQVLNEDGDVFKMITAQWQSIPVEEVTAEQRAQAKQVCYGMIYGIGPKALGEQLKVDENDAAAFIETFKAKYPGMRRYLRQTVDFCREKGYVQTMLGRKRYLSAITGTNPHARAQAERQAVNTTVQGSAADLVKTAMVRIDRKLMEKFPDCQATHKQKFYDKKYQKTTGTPRGGYLILQLHDELIYEVNERDLEVVADIIKDCMENAMEMPVKMPVKVKVGLSWGRLEEK